MFDDIASMAIFALDLFKEDYRKKYGISKIDKEFLDILVLNAKEIKNPINRKAYAKQVEKWINNHVYLI